MELPDHDQSTIEHRLEAIVSLRKSHDCRQLPSSSGSISDILQYLNPDMESPDQSSMTGQASTSRDCGPVMESPDQSMTGHTSTTSLGPQYGSNSSMLQPLQVLSPATGLPDQSMTGQPITNLVNSQIPLSRDPQNQMLQTNVITPQIQPLPSSQSSQCTGEGLGKRGDQWTETLCSTPRAFLYHNFLSKDECEHLINRAKPHMKRSKVRDAKTGLGVESSARTSFRMFFSRGYDKVITDIEKRIADITDIPIENGEGLQVLQYQPGQKFDAHYDFSTNKEFNKNGGYRIATVLMYLSDVEEGGETNFPYAKGCGKGGLSVTPKTGDALLFWSMKPNGIPDPLSKHGGCPVIKGDKWSCTKWLHAHEFKY